MAPLLEELQISFPSSNEVEDLNSGERSEIVDEIRPGSLTEMAFWYAIILISMLLLWLFVFFCIRIWSLRQKTQRQPQRRMYVGQARAPRSSSLSEPTIYVSPANLPPPPKYELMAPPSYEEVVGVHYPTYLPGNSQQPITQPISLAIQQDSVNPPAYPAENSSSSTNTVTVQNEVTATEDDKNTTSTGRRSSTTVAS